jgi:hypothetical protein
MLRSWTWLRTLVTGALQRSPILRLAFLVYTFLSLLLAVPALAFG